MSTFVQRIEPTALGTIAIFWTVEAIEPNRRRTCRLKSCGKRPVVWKRTATIHGQVVITTVWCAAHPPDGASQS